MIPPSTGPSNALETLYQELGDRALLLQRLPHQLVTIENGPTLHGLFPLGGRESFIPIRICAGRMSKKSGVVWIYIERHTLALKFQGFSDNDDDYGSFDAGQVVKRTTLEQPFHLATNGVELTALAYYYCFKLGVWEMRSFIFPGYLADALRSICDELEVGRGSSLIVRLPFRFDLSNIDRVSVQATTSEGTIGRDVGPTNSVTPSIPDLNVLPDTCTQPSTPSATPSLLNDSVSSFALRRSYPNYSQDNHYSTQNQTSKVDRYLALEIREIAILKKHDSHEQRINTINDRIRALGCELKNEQGNAAEVAKEKHDLDVAKKRLWDEMDKHEIYEIGKRDHERKRQKRLSDRRSH